MGFCFFNTVRCCLTVLLLAVSPQGAVWADVTDDEKAQAIVHMLDYVSVDYPESVENSQVIKQDEYAEQRDFAAQAITLLGQLPAVSEKDQLLQQARALLTRIEAKGAGSEISALAHQLLVQVIQSWKLSVAPRQVPDVRHGEILFAQRCAGCHGQEGKGNGPLAKGMDPAPRNFHDEPRMRQRSLYGLYNTITLGVRGTSMRAFNDLSEADRWALAFFAAGLRTSPSVVTEGEELWRQGQGKAEFQTLRTFVTTAPGEQAPVGSSLDAVRAYLTQQPQALQTAAQEPLVFSRIKIEEAALAYANGDQEAARRFAIAAYLEGVELIESALNNVDASLRMEIEREMMALRMAIANGSSVEAVTVQATKITTLLDRAAERLSNSTLSPNTAFVSSLLILLREGLESILIISTIVAFVVRTGRRDALPFIHLGWIGAMALGAVTWILARYMLSISGANRELTEGLTALLAAAMLLYVGWWLHSRSNAQAWNRYVREQLNSALATRTLWTMAGLSFLVVYRELFEVILFYETLWSQAGGIGHTAVLWGIATAAALLVLTGGMILRYSVRLPIGPFFTVASSLLAVMAVIFVGNGITALQAAGVLDVTNVHFFSLPFLGIHPTVQSLVPQALILALIAGGVWSNREKAD
ncbi:MAG: FTR1 family protein [Nitrospira sp.]|nr:FTR1 family protein [Nitrospira sp.]MDH4303890.1 FTR1 family protein [Nitrospira sp.]MDH5192750.1 FTR1 family protein [Nitrospira sp.]